MGDDSADAIKALLEAPRRDNSAYLEALRAVREAFAQAEADLGGKVTAATESSRDAAGNYVVTTIIKRDAQRGGKRKMSNGQPTTKLFRGFSQKVWKERFEEAGWPAQAADYMALWLTIGANDPPPDFEEIATMAGIPRE